MDIITEFIKLGIITFTSIIVGKFLYNNSSKYRNNIENNSTTVKTKLPHAIYYKNEENNQKKPVSIYNDWVKSQLPDFIPMDIIQKCLPNEKYECFDYIIGLQYYLDADHGKCPPRLEYEADNEEDLKKRIFLDISRHISYDVELQNRKKEELKWRYIDLYKQINNKWMYKENSNYMYNTIFDSRKYWMEYHLNLLKTVITEKELHAIINEYEKLINNRYQIPHWKFEREIFEFIEISNSKVNNGDGIEHPTEDEIIKE